MDIHFGHRLLTYIMDILYGRTLSTYIMGAVREQSWKWGIPVPPNCVFG